MKIRHVLIIAIVAILGNTAFNGISGALKRSDYQHCKVTTNNSAQECKVLTQYEGE